MASPADAFREALAAQRVAGSDFRLAFESVRSSTRLMAQELGVSQRTVQRWRNYDLGTGAERRNPSASPKASDIRAMADVEREQRALNQLADAASFDTDSVDVNYMTEAGTSYGSRHARTMVERLNMGPAVELYRSNAPKGDLDDAVATALGASYGLPEDILITDVSGLTVQ